jgi:hypothetical protein
MQKFGEGSWELGLSKRNEVGGVGKRTPRRSSGAIYWSRLSLILFSFFLISEINFGLKIILGNHEIIVKSQKNSPKAQKNSRKSLEKIWDVRNPNKIFGDQEKDFRAFQ